MSALIMNMKLNFGMTSRSNRSTQFTNNLFLAILTLILIGCGRDGNVENAANDTNEARMPNGQNSIQLPLNSPDDFVPVIHEIIRIDSLELLKALCHPNSEQIRYNNAYTVCEIRTSDMSDIDKFRHWFGGSSVTGETEIDLDTALIPVELGNDERHPTIILEKFEDHWYLVGMDWKE